MKWLDDVVVPALIFWGTATLISIVAVSIYIRTNSVQGFTFLHVLSTLIFLLFENSHPNRCEDVVFVCISLMVNGIEYPFKYLLAICLFSLETKETC